MMNNGQFNLFDFFNGGNVGTLAFGENAEPAEETLEEVTTSENIDEEDGMEDEDISEELEEDTKESSKKTNTSKTSSSGKNKKGKGIKGDTKISLPITCRGRNWSYVIEGFGTKTINEILEDLYAAGIVEVAHKEVNPIANEKAIKNQLLYFTSPTKESKSSVAVFSSNKSAVIADGLEQMPLTPEIFEGMDVDEISVLHAQELWEKGFPAYVNMGLSYCFLSNVGVPVIENSLKAGDLITLPKEIVVSGERQNVQIGILEQTEVTVSEVLNEYIPGIDATLKCIGDTIYCEYTGTPVTGLKKPGTTANGKEVIAKELITLPCKCYFVTLNQTFDFTPDMFGGKQKITSEEVLELLRKTYSLLRNKDRRVEVVYAKEQNLVSVALTSGTKGSAYALPEASDCGLFKLIRSVEELQAVKQLANFLGIYVPDKGPSQRIEVCPHAVYTATMGEGRELMRIKNITYELKRPKIPYKLFQGIVEDFKAHPEKERIVQICYDEKKHEYFLSFPSYEESSKAFIRYQFQSIAPVITIHSHNTMPAYFSHIDNRDESITGVYGVIGTVDKTPTYKFRVGMEGSFQELNLSDLFEEV